MIEANSDKCGGHRCDEPIRVICCIKRRFSSGEREPALTTVPRLQNVVRCWAEEIQFVFDGDTSVPKGMSVCAAQPQEDQELFNDTCVKKAMMLGE